MTCPCSQWLVISFYSSTIFENVGYSAEQALYASLGYGAIQVVFTIPTLFLIDPIGRRRLCLIVSPYLDSTDSRPSHSCVHSCWRQVFPFSKIPEARLLELGRSFCSCTSSQSLTHWARVRWLSNTRPRCSLRFNVNREWHGSYASTIPLVRVNRVMS